MGHEEITIIGPAIEALRAEGIDIVGPLPADTMFHPNGAGALRRSAHDVSRPGPDPGENPRLRRRRQCHAGSAIRANLPRSWHGVRHRWKGGREPCEPHSSAQARRPIDAMRRRPPSPILRSGAEARVSKGEPSVAPGSARSGPSFEAPSGRPRTTIRGEDLAADGLPRLSHVVAAHGLDPRKALGQNFLFDLNLTRKIARAAGPLAGVVGNRGRTRPRRADARAPVGGRGEGDRHRARRLARLARLAEIAAHWPGTA